jgi:Protein of unknown function (DUF551)
MISLSEAINEISKVMLPAAVVALFMGGFLFLQKDRIYRQPSVGWLDVKTHKIPEDIKGFLATDGKKVDSKYQPEWGPNGEAIFNRYEKTYVTHWQPFPEPPKK